MNTSGASTGVDDRPYIVRPGMTAKQAAAIAKPVTDDEWIAFDDHYFAACCDCGLAHRIEVRPREGGGFEVRNIRLQEFTDAVRADRPFPLAPQPREPGAWPLGDVDGQAEAWLAVFDCLDKHNPNRDRSGTGKQNALHEIRRLQALDRPPRETAVHPDTDRLDYLEHRLVACGSVEFRRAFDGDVQFNTESEVHLSGGNTIRECVDAAERDRDEAAGEQPRTSGDRA